jgi:hypothetical protein
LKWDIEKKEREKKIGNSCTWAEIPQPAQKTNPAHQPTASSTPRCPLSPSLADNPSPLSSQCLCARPHRCLSPCLPESRHWHVGPLRPVVLFLGIRHGCATESASVSCRSPRRRNRDPLDSILVGLPIKPGRRPCPSPESHRAPTIESRPERGKMGRRENGGCRRRQPCDLSSPWPQQPT